MDGSPLIYFSDPVLRAPTIGSMLMCLAAALVGVVVFLKKESLIGEALSHAAYPGVITGILIAGIFEVSEEREIALSSLVIIGAFLSAVVGLKMIYYLRRHLNIRSDSALCFILSVFFGIGLTLVSEVQFVYPSLYRQAQTYLYGQAATMTDVHIAIYGSLSVAVILVLLLFYKEIQALAFDHSYAKTLGINVKAIDTLVFLLIVLSVVIGIRSVGVVLMSAMLIAPAAAARQYTNKLYWMFILASFFGLLSAFLGNYLSVELTKSIATSHRFALPTGPMIVIVASLICFFSLMLAPERGFLLRMLRIGSFRYHCMGENLLKAIWRLNESKPLTFEEIAKSQNVSRWYLYFILNRLVHQKWLQHKKDGYALTPEGRLRAARIVRLHRLWEVYLVDYLGVGAERVHRSAEEMEHIITPELEAELTLLLKDPKQDPHSQPIPSKENNGFSVLY